MAVAQGLQGFEVRRIAAEEPFNLLQPPRGQHDLHPEFDAAVKLLPGQGQAQLQHLIGGVLKAVGLDEAREGLAGGLHHLQGPDDPVGVVGVEPGGAGRVQVQQALIEGGQPHGPQLPAQAVPDPRRRRALGKEPREQRLEIEAGAPHHQGRRPPVLQVRQDLAPFISIAGRVIGLRGVRHVDEVVGHPGHFCGGGLGGADI